MHGKPSVVRARSARLLKDLPERFTVGRYHSLFAEPGSFPDILSATAETDDGIIMAIEHKTLPIAAVQFHPESVMTSPGEVGMPILEAALSVLCETAEA
jgi:anthranilate synthase